MNGTNLIRKLLYYFNLESEIDDFDKIHETIVKDSVFKGTNLWILMFAIVVASVGLNMNSTAVIIGAMLISPLMGPINGMGYSIATYDFLLFKKSFKNYSFAVLSSLAASTAYFALSPISTAHSELLARTSPTIYDVLIALFGGLAGIVAISSKQKGNVIPGVAIATALMPPLCTAGYGLATAQFDFFFGAIYLFTINSVFIALASVAVSQILKFPIRTLVEEKQKNIVNRWISLVIALVVIPSIYFGYNLVQKEKFNENATKYIRNIGVFEGNFLLKHEVNPNKKTISLTYGGATMSESQKNRITEIAADFFTNGAIIRFEQGLSFDAFDNKNSEVENLKAELSRMNLLLQEKEQKIDSITEKKYFGRQILSEIKNLYPQISTCSFSESLIFNDSLQTPENKGIVMFGINGKISNKEKQKIEQWLKTRLQNNNIQIYYSE